MRWNVLSVVLGAMAAGVLESAEVPADVWAHFGAIETDGFRTLVVGQQVSFEVLDLGAPIQDGYRYRAERILPRA